MNLQKTELLFREAKILVDNLYGPERQPVFVAIGLDDGTRLEVPILARQSKRMHIDYKNRTQFFHWQGIDWKLNSTQAYIVRILLAAWEDGQPDVGEIYLLSAVNDGTGAIHKIFHDHPGWGRLIVPGRQWSTFRLGGANPSRT